MTKLRKYQKKAIFSIAMLSLMMAGFLLSAATPGSSEDPLVTRSWVNSYVTHKCDALEARIDTISEKLGVEKELCLWIGKNYITENGVKESIDVAPLLLNSRTIVPLRYVGEFMDADFKWDNINKMVTYIKGNTTIKLWIGKKTISVNGVNNQIDTAPTLVNNRTMVPLRFVVEELGADVKWNNEEKKVTITY